MNFSASQEVCEIQLDSLDHFVFLQEDILCERTEGNDSLNYEEYSKKDSITVDDSSCCEDDATGGLQKPFFPISLKRVTNFFSHKKFFLYLSFLTFLSFLFLSLILTVIFCRFYSFSFDFILFFCGLNFFLVLFLFALLSIRGSQKENEKQKNEGRRWQTFFRARSDIRSDFELTSTACSSNHETLRPQKKVVLPPVLMENRYSLLRIFVFSFCVLMMLNAILSLFLYKEMGFRHFLILDILCALLLLSSSFMFLLPLFEKLFSFRRPVDDFDPRDAFIEERVSVCVEHPRKISDRIFLDEGKGGNETENFYTATVVADVHCVDEDRFCSIPIE